MNARLFTSPVMKGPEVKTWCKMVRENQGKIALFELQLNAALKQYTSKKTKAAS